MRIKIARKKAIFLKLLIIILVLVLITISFIRHIKGNIMPVVVTMSEATVRSLAVGAINNASHVVLDETVNYEDLVSIVKNNNGDIELIETNTAKINRISRDLANIAEKNVEDIKEQTLTLPIGVFTGSIMLSGVGPKVEINMLPIGSVLCDFVSSFEEVGINQTKHSIYINANTTINIILPVSSVPVSICTSILVVENIIVGKVPNFYLENKDSDGVLDLLPSR